MTRARWSDVDPETIRWAREYDQENRRSRLLVNELRSGADIRLLSRSDLEILERRAEPYRFSELARLELDRRRELFR